MTIKDKNRDAKERVVTLKAVAAHVGLSAGTVSSVLNDAPSAKHIPLATRQRILAAARQLDYRPNFFARSLRKRRTLTIGVIAEAIGEPYGSGVIAGIESGVRHKSYFFLTGVHHHDHDLFERYSRLLLQRGAEGIITVDYNMPHSMPVPVVAIAGHAQREGVTNIVLDHRHAAELALQHLKDLGHARIAVFRGQKQSSDAEPRWNAIEEVAREMGLRIDPDLVVQLHTNDPTPQVGYPYGKQLLAKKKPFTALLAYNDISAIGAIRAFQEAGLRVPEDVSVVGFDDIPAAAFSHPSLTTIRQPLHRMGELAAQVLIETIEGDGRSRAQLAVQPEIIVRESTARASA